MAPHSTSHLHGTAKMKVPSSEAGVRSSGEEVMVACFVDGVGERVLMERNIDCVQARPLRPGCSDCFGSQGGAGVGEGAKGLTQYALH